MPYTVVKAIEFSYGHRLLGHGGKCRYLHGHNGLLEVMVNSRVLDELGMVVDCFKIRDVIKGWIDEHLDHKMILCKNDPVVETLMAMDEPLYLVDENPTAENIARIIFEQVKALGFNPSEIKLWETPSSCASYHEGNGYG